MIPEASCILPGLCFRGASVCGLHSELKDSEVCPSQMFCWCLLLRSVGEVTSGAILQLENARKENIRNSLVRKKPFTPKYDDHVRRRFAPNPWQHLQYLVLSALSSSLQVSTAQERNQGGWHTVVVRNKGSL